MTLESQLTSKNNEQRLTVSVALGDTKAEFSGTPEAVLQSVNNFIAKQIPELDIARRLSLNFGTKDLVDKFKDYIKITPEGPRVWNQDKKLSDKEIVALQLVAQRIASETREGLSSTATLTSLQEATSLNPKSLSSRLSEMLKSGYVSKETSGDKSQFRITTIGIDWLSSLLSKKT